MDYYGSHVLWFLLLFNLCLVNSHSIKVSLGFISPLDKSLGALSSLGNELVSVYKLAAEAANKHAKSSRSRIRINTNFTGLIKDEGSNPTQNCGHVIRQFNSNLKVIGVVGPFRSSCALASQNLLAAAGSHLSQISYGSTSTELSDKSKYPKFLRTSSSDASQGQALADLLRHFRWKKVGVVTADDSYGRGLADELQTRAKDNGVLVVERARFLPGDSDSVIDDKLQLLKNAGTRVNVLVAFGQDVLRILERARLKKMTGEGWVWIGSDGVAASWVAFDKDVKTAAQGLVAIAPKMPSGSKLLELIMKWFGKNDTEYPGILWKLKDPAVSPYVAQVYDAVFAYYKALDKLARKFKISRTTPTNTVRDLVFNELKTFKDASSGIDSLTGTQLYFDVEGNTLDGPSLYDVLNFVGGEFVNVGSWNETSSGLTLPFGRVTWPGGTKMTPTDRGTPGKPLFKIGFLAPTHQNLGSLSAYGKELVSAFKVALDIVNNNNNFEVELDAKIFDEGEDGRLSCDKAAQNLVGQNVAAVVGAFRSSCSIAASRVLGLPDNKIPMISYGSTSKELSDKQKHKYFFRVVPSDIHQSQALAKLISKYSFKEVSTIASEELSSREIADTFEQAMVNRSIPIRVSLRFIKNTDADGVRPVLKSVEDAGSRVNLLSALPQDADVAYQVLKELSMAGKGWIWLGSDGATSTTFSANSELAKVMQGLIGVGPKAGEGSLYLKFLSTWLEKDAIQYPGVVHTLNTPSSLPFTAQVSDAVNGIANALSDLIRRKVVTYNTNIKTVKEHLYKKLKTYNSMANGYPSTTGTRSVYFDDKQDGPPVLDVVNLVDAKWKAIGSYSGKTDKLILNQDPIFPGGTTVPVVGAGKVMYNVAAVFPKHPRLGPLAELGREWEKAFKGAVNWLNKNQSLEVGFKFITIDGGLHEADCANIVQRIPQNVDIVIGEARSSCTAAIYNNVENRGIPVISYGATAKNLANKGVYPRLFRTCPSDTNQAVAIGKLVRKYKWDKIGIIASRSTYSTGLAYSVKSELSSKGVKVTDLEEFSPGTAERITQNVVNLKRSGGAVNLIISQTSDAERVYQEAFEQGMTGKGWTWLGSNGAASSTFTKSQHLQHAMQGMVGFRPKEGRGTLFQEMLKNWVGTDNYKKRKLPNIAQIFDAVLAPAEALHRLHKAKAIDENTSRSRIRMLLVQALRRMRTPSSGFHSATGEKSYFDEDQDSPGEYDMVNLNGNSWVKVGRYDSSELHITGNVVWPGGTVNTPPSDPPSDGTTPVNHKAPKRNTGLIALAVIFGVFGLLVILFMVYIIHRVRYRHLYMQSDASSNGLFSVLYGHRQRNANGYGRPEDVRIQTHTNGDVKHETDL